MLAISSVRATHCCGLFETFELQRMLSRRKALQCIFPPFSFFLFLIFNASDARKFWIHVYVSRRLYSYITLVSPRTRLGEEYNWEELFFILRFSWNVEKIEPSPRYYFLQQKIKRFDKLSPFDVLVRLIYFLMEWCPNNGRAITETFFMGKKKK